MIKKLLAGFASLFMTSAVTSPATANQDITILDVRTPQEFADNHIQGAVNVDFNSPNFKDEVAKLDKAKAYKLYCRSGNRSGQALKIMTAMAFTNVENLGAMGAAAKKLQQSCTPKSC